MAVKDGVAVNPLGCADAIDALGVNDKVQLAMLEVGVPAAGCAGADAGGGDDRGSGAGSTFEAG